MYILKAKTSMGEKAKKTDINIQLIRWIYNSHCWTPAEEANQPLLCEWCGATSSVPFQVDADHPNFCPDNPLITQIFDKAKSIVLNELSKRAHPINETIECPHCGNETKPYSWCEKCGKILPPEPQPEG